MPHDLPQRKALADGYAPSPFYFSQVRAGGRRCIAAWSESPAQCGALFEDVIASFSAQVDVYLKHEHVDEQVFDRFEGEVDRDEVLAAFAEKRDVLEIDGSLQLVVRRSDTGEHVVFDEHGIVFVYSVDPVYEDVCEKHGFEPREERLLYQYPHSHIRPASGANNVDDLVERLGLEGAGTY